MRRSSRLSLGILLMGTGLLLLGAAVATAQGNNTGTTTSANPLQDAAVAIVGGIIQLIVGIGLAMISIVFGLNVMKRILPTIDLMGQVKKGNLAVGIMLAGVVIAYTQVLNTGIRGMGTALGAATTANAYIVAIVAGLVSIGFGIAFASLGVTLAFKVLDKLTKGIDEAKELNKGNLAVGLFIAGVLYGVSSMIAAAISGIGTALSKGLGAILGG